MSGLINATVTAISKEMDSKFGGTYRIVNVEPDVSPETARIIGAKEYKGKFELKSAVSDEGLLRWFLERKGTVVKVRAGKDGTFEIDLSDNEDVPVIQTQPADSTPKSAPPQSQAGYQPLNLYDAEVKIYEFDQVIRLCMRYARETLELTGMEYTVEDVRSLATTMAIEASPYRVRQSPIPAEPVMTLGMMVWQPRPPVVAIDSIHELAMKYTNIPQDKVERIRRGFMSVFSKWNVDDETRHRFCHILFGEGSTKKLTPSQMLAVCLWSGSTEETNYTPSLSALQEMRAIFDYAEVNDGK